MLQPIYVTKAFLPPLAEYNKFLNKIWESGQLTNQGPLLKEFEQKTGDYLGVTNFHFVSNGTVALQLALSSLDITEGEVITTPFSYVASTSAILWERCKPVYVDINPETLCIDASKIEEAITPKTKAILAVHVFGIPCDIEAIQEIATKYNLKVIYDGAHAFGAKYKGKSLLSFGDITTCSFHATKLFHTIEGGAIVANDKVISDKIELQKRFGHNGDEHIVLGINAKANEFQAAMGLVNLKYINSIMASRNISVKHYDRLLSGLNGMRIIDKPEGWNFSYYPIIFESVAQMHKVSKALDIKGVYPRRYFYPSLNTLPYINEKQICETSEEIAGKILCLPLHHELSHEDIEKISSIISKI